MDIELEFAELHNPLFLAGTNLQMKLDPKKRSGMVLRYDLDNQQLLVYWQERLAIVPSSNVSSMTPVNARIFGILPGEKLGAPGATSIAKKIATPTTPKPIEHPKPMSKQTPQASLVGKLKQPSAQVSGPAMHVFEDGPGKTKN